MGEVPKTGELLRVGEVLKTGEPLRVGEVLETGELLRVGEVIGECEVLKRGEVLGAKKGDFLERLDKQGDSCVREEVLVSEFVPYMGDNLGINTELREETVEENCVVWDILELVMHVEATEGILICSEVIAGEVMCEGCKPHD